MVWHSKSYFRSNEYVSFYFGFRSWGCWCIYFWTKPGPSWEAARFSPAPSSLSGDIIGASAFWSSRTELSNCSVFVISSLNIFLRDEYFIFSSHRLIICSHFDSFDSMIFSWLISMVVMTTYALNRPYRCKIYPPPFYLKNISCILLRRWDAFNRELKQIPVCYGPILLC